MAAALSTTEIATELAASEVTLPRLALEQLSTYLELLLRWNRRINLTGLRDPRLIVRRLFGESLYVANVVELKGWLVDVGSGAGFPGLALKLAVPELRVTLVESHHRKGAFLKEVIRECLFTTTEVVTERFEVWSERLSAAGAVIITTRAVSVSDRLLRSMADIVQPDGIAAFLTSEEIAQQLRQRKEHFLWGRMVGIPGSRRSVVLLGRPALRSSM